PSAALRLSVRRCCSSRASSSRRTALTWAAALPGASANRPWQPPRPSLVGSREERRNETVGRRVRVEHSLHPSAPPARSDRKGELDREGLLHDGPCTAHGRRPSAIAGGRVTRSARYLCRSARYFCRRELPGVLLGDLPQATLTDRFFAVELGHRGLSLGA